MPRRIEYSGTDRPQPIDPNRVLANRPAVGHERNLLCGSSRWRVGGDTTWPAEARNERRRPTLKRQLHVALELCAEGAGVDGGDRRLDLLSGACGQRQKPTACGILGNGLDDGQKAVGWKRRQSGNQRLGVGQGRRRVD